MKLTMGKIDIALIQEPWVNKGLIKGFSKVGGIIISPTNEYIPRTCIYVRNIVNAMPLLEFCSRDLTTAKIILKKEGHQQEIFVVSAYLPFDSTEPPPSTEMKRVIDYCIQNNKKLVIGCDANAHHIIWGSTGNNRRGENLLEYLVSKKLSILNLGNEPTFVTTTRREVIDITLGTNNIEDLVEDWHVSNEPSMSDHRHISFKIRAGLKERYSYRNPRKTDWESYKEDLDTYLKGISRDIRTVIDVELAVDQLQHAILSSYHQNCPTKPACSSRLVPWWNHELSRLRAKTRRLFNLAKRTGNWADYKLALTSYNKAIRKAKRSSWKEYCWGIENIPDSARFMKIMANKAADRLTAIKLPDGKYSTDGRGTLQELLRVHFPDSVEMNSLTYDREQPNLEQGHKTCREDWHLARKVINTIKIKWAIDTFKPFKSPGIDGVIPVLLQKGIDLLVIPLCHIFRACIALGYIPVAWREVRVVFIPKPGRSNYTEAKAYRPISLSSFVLKTLEKIVDKYIRDEALCIAPLHRNQFAYQTGRSTETALHVVVARLEKAIKYRELALGAFLDIEGAFDRTSFEAINSAARRHGVEPTICRWIISMLKTRVVMASVLEDTMRISTTKGCPQGGVLSPLLWCLVVDELLVILNERGYYSIGYADDVAIIINGTFPNTVSEILQSALKEVEKWCDRIQLSINPQKTVIVPFTKRKKLVGLKEPLLFGERIEMSSEVKYLGLILDKGLTWKMQLETVTQKATKALWACRNAIGKTWGLKPKVVLWIYTAIVRPIITYASTTWWMALNVINSRNKLSKVQRLACLSVTGAMRTTPTAAMEVLLNLPPLHIYVEGEARVGRYRLQCGGMWDSSSCDYGHQKFGRDMILDTILEMGTDKMIPTLCFNKPVTVSITERGEWTEGTQPIPKDGLVWFTDGSKTNDGTGAGAYCRNTGEKFWTSLGKYATVFQAEIYAIIICATEMLGRNYKGKNIYILSDSQSALFALDSVQFNSKLVWNCFQLLSGLAERYKVHLFWVPGHEGIEGNEMADSLAKKGASVPFIGPEPVCGISYAGARQAIREWMERRHLNAWRTTPGQRQAKEFIVKPSQRRTKELLKLSKKQLRTAVGLFTGHCPLKRHLHLMGLENDPMCRFCNQNVETASHILCSCVALERLRFVNFEAGILTPNEVTKLPVVRVLSFIYSFNLLRE